MTEADIMRRLQKLATTLGGRLFRNNVGKAWIGRDEEIRETKRVLVYAGDVVIRQGRRFHAGLAPGSGDLIGFMPVKITADMVGTVVAVFASPEIKTPTGRATTEQADWIAMVQRFGGFAGIARNDEDLTTILCPPHLFAQGVDKTTAIGNSDQASSLDARSSPE